MWVLGDFNHVTQVSPGWDWHDCTHVHTVTATDCLVSVEEPGTFTLELVFPNGVLWSLGVSLGLPQ